MSDAKQAIMNTYNDYLSDGDVDSLLTFYDQTKCKLDFEKQGDQIVSLFNNLIKKGDKHKAKLLLKASGLEQYVDRIPLIVDVELKETINVLETIDLLKNGLKSLFTKGRLGENFGKVYETFKTAKLSQEFFKDLIDELQIGYDSILQYPNLRCDYDNQEFNKLRFMIDYTGVNVSKEVADKAFNYYLRITEYESPKLSYMLDLMDLSGHLPDVPKTKRVLDWAFNKSLIESGHTDFGCGGGHSWSNISLYFVKCAVKLSEKLGLEVSDDTKQGLFDSLKRKSYGISVSEYYDAYIELNDLLNYRPDSKFFENSVMIEMCKQRFDLFNKLVSKFNLELGSSFYDSAFKSVFKEIKPRSNNDELINELSNIIKNTKYRIPDDQVKDYYTKFLEDGGLLTVKSLDDKFHNLPEFTDKELECVQPKMLYALIRHADIRRFSSEKIANVKKQLSWFEQKTKKIPEKVYTGVYEKLIDSSSINHALAMIEVLEDYSGVKPDFRALVNK